LEEFDRPPAFGVEIPRPLFDRRMGVREATVSWYEKDNGVPSYVEYVDDIDEGVVNVDEGVWNPADDAMLEGVENPLEGVSFDA
jgi:hypothetical protein